MNEVFELDCGEKRKVIVRQASNDSYAVIMIAADEEEKLLESFPTFDEAKKRCHFYKPFILDFFD